MCLQGEDNVEYFLGLTPSGIIVLRNKNTVGNYYWPRISKIYFKGRYFMLRVTDKNVSNNFLQQLSLDLNKTLFRMMKVRMGLRHRQSRRVNTSGSVVLNTMRFSG